MSFSKLDKDVLSVIVSHIDPKLLPSLYLNQAYYSFFKPLVLKNQFIEFLFKKDWSKLEKIISLRPELITETMPDLVNFLASLVVNGQQEDAEKLITLLPSLLTKQGNITDRKRIFEGKTAFQYILWSLDVRHMAPMMIKCIPVSQEGLEIVLHLIQQFENHEKELITYSLNDKKITEKHHDIQPFAHAAQDYAAHFEEMSLTARKTYWSENICQNQLLIPFHVMQHYSEPRVPFNPAPDFKNDNFKRCLDIFLLAEGKQTFWYSEEHLKACNENQSCVVRGNRKEWGPLVITYDMNYRPDFYFNMMSDDALVLLDLYKTRKEDYCHLKTLLDAKLVQIKESIQEDTSQPLNHFFS